MSTDLHPEALLERAQRGTQGAQERAELDAHLEACEACALAFYAREDFAQMPLDDTNDRLLVRRITEAAIAEQAATSRVLPWVAAAAAMLFVVGGATAATYLWVQSKSPIDSEVPSFPAQGPSAEEHETAPAEVEEDASKTVELQRVVVTPATRRERPRRRPVRAVDAAQLEPAVDAATLLRDANQARHQKQYAKAKSGYERLLREFPSSREATVVHVSLGRLLLDRLGDPRGALAQFEAYLRSSGASAALGAEALSGKARSLRQLGRAPEELATWRLLVKKHPSSHHGAAAKVRISELESSGSQ